MEKEAPDVRSERARREENKKECARGRWGGLSVSRALAKWPLVFLEEDARHCPFREAALPHPSSPLTQGHPPR